MKKNLLKSLAFAAIAALMTACTQKPAQTQEEPAVLPEDVEVGPYHITALTENIYHIQDYNAANPAGESFDENGEKTHFNNCSDLYLLKGDDAALLIDLSNFIKWDSTAVESLRQLVAERIDGKPLTITFTHNHGDHTGMYPAYAGDTTVCFMLPRIDFEPLLEKLEGSKYALYDEGQTFDLGGIVVNTVIVHFKNTAVFRNFGNYCKTFLFLRLRFFFADATKKRLRQGPRHGIYRRRHRFGSRCLDLQYRRLHGVYPGRATPH